MPVFYHGGQAYNVPAQIQNLPLDLLRSHEYPRDPREMQQAVDQSGDTPPSDYLPARMMETRWKTPPYQRAWGSNVVALMEAMRAHARLHAELAVTTAHVPVMDFHAAPASLQAERLPQSSDNFDENIDVVPQARNALPDDRIAVRGPDLAELAMMDVRQRTANNAVKPAQLQNALDSAAASLRAVNKIMGG